MTLLIWSISFSRCGTLHEVVPLDWLSGSAFLVSSWLWVCPSAFSSRCCLLELSCLVSSWFWRVNSAIVTRLHMLDRRWLHGGHRLTVAARITGSIPTLLRAWTGNPWSCSNHFNPLSVKVKEITEFKESKTLKILYSPQTGPTDDASMISGLNCLRCYQRSLVNLEKEE